MSPARQAFSERSDNQDGFTPENVVFYDNFISHGGEMDGGGLPLGSGDLIEAARKLLADEGIVGCPKCSALYNGGILTSICPHLEIRRDLLSQLQDRASANPDLP